MVAQLFPHTVCLSLQLLSHLGLLLFPLFHLFFQLLANLLAVLLRGTAHLLLERAPLLHESLPVLLELLDQNLHIGRSERSVLSRSLGQRQNLMPVGNCVWHRRIRPLRHVGEPPRAVGGQVVVLVIVG